MITALTNVGNNDFRTAYAKDVRATNFFVWTICSFVQSSSRINYEKFGESAIYWFKNNTFYGKGIEFGLGFSYLIAFPVLFN